MTKDKSIAAAMLNPPFSIRAEKAGLKSIGSAAEAIGAYQATERLRAAQLGDGKRRHCW